VSDELGRIWKEVFMAYFQAIFEYFHGRTEVKHEHPVRIANLWTQNQTWDIPNTKLEANYYTTKLIELSRFTVKCSI
jgi:hypothetical protein